MNKENLEITMLPIEKVNPDPKNFRTVLNQTTIQELSESIKLRGVIEPLIVRPDKIANDGSFIIIAGERRRKGAELAGLKEIPCVIRDVADEEAEDIRHDENAHREDLTAMDEARMYLHFKNRGKTLAEISAITGKQTSFIHTRLKLNDLIPELQADIEKDFLPVSYGYLLCAYSAEIQKEALDNQIYKTLWVEDETHEDGGFWRRRDPTKGLKSSVANLGQWLENNYTYALDKLPFDKADTSLLHLNGTPLACLNCAERSGANAGFFNQNETDYCLNRPCAKNKVVQFCQITRNKEAQEKNIPPTDILLLSESWSESSTPEGFLPKSKYTDLDFNDPDGDNAEHCEYERIGVFSGDGKLKTVCLKDSKCSVHYPAGTVFDPDIEDKKRQNLRKEEKWNLRVKEAIKEKLFEKAKAESGFGLLDAQTRLELSPKKHQKRHLAYLQQVETSDPDRRIPKLYAIEEAKQPLKEPKKQTSVKNAPSKDAETVTNEAETALEAVFSPADEAEAVQESENSSETVEIENEVITEQPKPRKTKAEGLTFEVPAENLPLEELAAVSLPELPEELPTTEEILSESVEESEETFDCVYCGAKTTLNQSPDGFTCAKCDSEEAETSSESPEPTTELNSSEISQIFQEF